MATVIQSVELAKNVLKAILDGQETLTGETVIEAINGLEEATAILGFNSEEVAVEEVAVEEVATEEVAVEEVATEEVDIAAHLGLDPDFYQWTAEQIVLHASTAAANGYSIECNPFAADPESESSMIWLEGYNQQLAT